MKFDPYIAVGAVVLAGFGITQTPNWKHSVIRSEWNACQQKQSNLRKAGRAAAAFNLMVECNQAYELQMAENFGTIKPQKVPTPIW